jgi:hypothetical protein
MIDMTSILEVKKLKQDLHLVFDTPQGKDVLKFMQELGGWYPTVWDSMETNSIIARDANRKLLGTIRTILELSPEQIVALANKEDV